MDDKIRGGRRATCGLLWGQHALSICYLALKEKATSATLGIKFLPLDGPRWPIQLSSGPFISYLIKLWMYWSGKLGPTTFPDSLSPTGCLVCTLHG